MGLPLRPDVSSFLCEDIGARLGRIHWRPTQLPATVAWCEAIQTIYKLTAKFAPSKVPCEGSSVHLLVVKAEHEKALTVALVAATSANADAAAAAQAAASAATGASEDSATPEANTEGEAASASNGIAAEPSSSGDVASACSVANEQTLLAAASAASDEAMTRATKSSAASELPKWMKPGAFAKLTVTRHMELYNGFQGKVEALLATEVQVTMLEGQKKGEMTKFNPKPLTLVSEPEPPKKLFAEAASVAPLQRKQKTEAREWAYAADILGLACSGAVPL